MVDKPQLPADIDWPAQTVAWWETLGSPGLVESWTAEDWQYLLDTALLHADVWGGGNFDRLPELRTRLERFGITPAARASLGLAKTESKKEETVLDEFSKRLAQRRSKAAR